METFMINILYMLYGFIFGIIMTMLAQPQPRGLGLPMVNTEKEDDCLDSLLNNTMDLRYMRTYSVPANETCAFLSWLWENRDRPEADSIRIAKDAKTGDLEIICPKGYAIKMVCEYLGYRFPVVEAFDLREEEDRGRLETTEEFIKSLCPEEKEQIVIDRRSEENLIVYVCIDPENKDLMNRFWTAERTA